MTVLQNNRREYSAYLTLSWISENSLKKLLPSPISRSTSRRHYAGNLGQRQGTLRILCLLDSRVVGQIILILCGSNMPNVSASFPHFSLSICLWQNTEFPSVCLPEFYRDRPRSKLFLCGICPWWWVCLGSGEWLLVISNL